MVAPTLNPNVRTSERYSRRGKFQKVSENGVSNVITELGRADHRASQLMKQLGNRVLFGSVFRGSTWGRGDGFPFPELFH